MTTQAEKLIGRALSGERLSSSERRHCVAYKLATDPTMTKVEMGRLFQVSEGMIRQDILKIRQDKAKSIREDDIGLVIADIAYTFERQVEDLEKSKTKCDLGTRTYLEHCRALAKMQVERIELLQGIGYYPKNLGNMTVQKFEYRAVVGRDGSVDTRPSDLQLDEGGKILDAEYEDVKLLPAPEETHGDGEQE